MSDREEVLAWARALVQEKNCVFLDTETTGLHGEIVSWAVVALDGTVLGSGYVKPTEPIAAEAQAVHKISDAMVESAPGFADAWPVIWALVEGKTVVIYNAPFDVARLATSARRAGIRLGQALDTRCAMAQFAKFYGEWNEYHGDYRWQSLTTACRCLGIDAPDHSAIGDAKATAALIRTLARMGEYAEQLPEEAREAVVEKAAEMLCSSPALTKITVVLSLLESEGEL